MALQAPPSVAQLDGSPRRRYYTGGDIARVQAINDLRARAHKLMPRFALEYLEGGAGEEATLARERESFAEWRVMPHTLVDEAHRDMTTAIIGRDAPLPLVVAPTGLAGVFMRGADTALAQGASRSGVPFIQSTMSNERMEDVAKVPGLRHWWQLYVFGEEAIWQELVDRAAGFVRDALAVDQHVLRSLAESAVLGVDGVDRETRDLRQHVVRRLGREAGEVGGRVDPLLAGRLCDRGRGHRRVGRRSGLRQCRHWGGQNCARQESSAMETNATHEFPCKIG